MMRDAPHTTWRTPESYQRSRTAIIQVVSVLLIIPNDN